MSHCCHKQLTEFIVFTFANRCDFPPYISLTYFIFEITWFMERLYVWFSFWISKKPAYSDFYPRIEIQEYLKNIVNFHCWGSMIISTSINFMTFLQFILYFWFCRINNLILFKVYGQLYANKKWVWEKYYWTWKLHLFI